MGTWATAAKCFGSLKWSKAGKIIVTTMNEAENFVDNHETLDFVMFFYVDSFSDFRDQVMERKESAEEKANGRRIRWVDDESGCWNGVLLLFGEDKELVEKINALPRRELDGY